MVRFERLDNRSTENAEVFRVMHNDFDKPLGLLSSCVTRYITYCLLALEEYIKEDEIDIIKAYVFSYFEKQKNKKNEHEIILTIYKGNYIGEFSNKIDIRA